MKRLVIANGEVVTPFSRFRADVVIEKGIIRAVGRDMVETGDQVIDAEGKLVLPGIIDAHTHMALPMKGTTSSDSFLTGTRAAAHGGVTTIIDFTEMASGSALAKAFAARKKQAMGTCAIDFGLHVCIQGWSKRTADQIPRLIDKGVTSFKMFTVYRERGLMSEDGEIFEALQAISKHGGTVTAHCESAGLVDAYTARVLAGKDKSASRLAESRPNAAEGEAIQRMISLAEVSAGRLYIVHISTREGLHALTEGQRRGVKVVGETCPQYLVLDRDSLAGKTGHLFTCVPPLRDPLDNMLLWQGLEEGTISVVGTDHCPFMREQKDRYKTDFTKIPLGLPGIETLLPLLYSSGVATGQLTVNQLVQVVSANPAMVFGLYPRKGIIQPGSDADIVIFDPQRTKTLRARHLHMNTDYSPFEGMKLTGWPETTILRGKVIVDKGRYLGKPTDGAYLHRDVASD